MSEHSADFQQYLVLLVSQRIWERNGKDLVYAVLD